MDFKKKLPDFRKLKYVPTVVLLQSFYFTQKFALSNTRAFHKNSLSVACCTFGMLEIGTLTPNRFKNQFSDTLKLLEHNCNHQQKFVKQRTVALHHCGFKLKLPIHFH